jgi:molybdopterin-binding protein
MNRIGLSNPLVLAEAATEIAGAMAIKRNPDAAIMLSVSRGFLMERTEAIRLFLEGQNDLLSGVWRYRDLCAPKPGMTPLNRAPDMVVTFMPISTTLETRAPLLRKRRNELRFGRRAPRETADAVREARETMPALNSQADYESAFMARRMSILATPMLAEAGADPTVVACVDNVIRLTLEDRLYGFVKQRRGVLMHVADCKARTVVVVISKARVLQGMEIAELLSLEGLNTFVTFDALTRDDCNQVTSALTGVGSGDRSAFLASLARMKFEAGPASRLPVAQRFAAPVVKLPPGDETLVIAGLADPSYITATQSLSEALARFGHVTVFDGSEKGRDKVRAADVELVDAPSLGETVDSGAVDGALRAMIAEMERGETNGSTDPKALVWLAASFSRLISAGRTGLLQELSNVAALRSLLATGRYRAIVTVPGRMACARAATIMARAMKLPSIDVQAFFISKHPRYYPSLADMYCGVTDDQVEDYRSHNPDPAQEIVCIGSLMIDRRMHNVSQMDRAAARKQLGLPLDRAILLYCAQHGGDREDNEAILMSARAAQGIPNALAVVKLHPRVAESAVETTRAILSSENLEDVKVSRNADVYALIRAADVVVTRFSNVGLEAAVMGRPVISVNTTGADYIVDPARMGVALRATSKEELAEHVRKLMTDPEAKKALERSRENYFARNPALIDSTAAENFAAIYRKAIGAPS